MRSRKSNDVLKIFNNFQKTISHKPGYKDMFDEIRMMQFKIKPMQGDILVFNLQDKQLIELLWSLGKLDELFQHEYKRLSIKEKNTFFRIFDSMYQKLQTELNKLNLHKEQIARSSPAVEMEIFREQQARRKLN